MSKLFFVATLFILLSMIGCDRDGHSAKVVQRDIRAIMNACNEYKAAHGEYPPSFASLKNGAYLAEDLSIGDGSADVEFSDYGEGNFIISVLQRGSAPNIDYHARSDRFIVDTK